MKNKTPLLTASETELILHGTGLPSVGTASRKTRRTVLRVGEHTNDTPKPVIVVEKLNTADMKKGVFWCGHDRSVLHAHTCNHCSNKFYLCTRCEYLFLSRHYGL
jgi:hypothetical protein